MKMHLETSDQNLISNYGKGVLSVNGQDFHQNILITKTRVVEDWFSGEIKDLTLAHFDPLLSPVPLFATKVKPTLWSLALM